MRHTTSTNHDLPGIAFEPGKFIGWTSDPATPHRRTKTGNIIDVTVGVCKGMPMCAVNINPLSFIRNMPSTLPANKKRFVDNIFFLVFKRPDPLEHACTLFIQTFQRKAYCIRFRTLCLLTKPANFTTASLKLAACSSISFAVAADDSALTTYCFVT